MSSSSSSSSTVEVGAGLDEAAPVESVLEDPLNLHNPSAQGKNVKGINWIVTLWNTTPAEITIWYHAQEERIAWVVACEDKGAATEREHIHIAVGFKKPVYFTTWQSWFGRQQHYEVSKHKFAAIKYVGAKGRHSENKRVFLDVNVPEPSERTERRDKQQEFWEGIQDAEDIVNVQELLQRRDYATYIPQRKMAIEYVLETRSFDRERSRKRSVFWIYGESGNGKSLLLTRFADRHKPWADCTFSRTSGQLVCPHFDPRTCVFDDIDLKKCNKEQLFNLLDNYNIVTDKKGGHQMWRPDFVLVSSITNPFELASMDGWNSNEQKQIIRRLTYVVHADYNPVTDERKYFYCTVERVLGDYKGSNPTEIHFDELLDIFDTSFLN